MGFFRDLVRRIVGGEPESTPPTDRPTPMPDPPARPAVSREAPSSPAAREPAGLLGLGPGEFTSVAARPSTAIEVDRPDAIPSLDDPRTRRIDAEMVALGLISPEQPVEIHRVGDEVARAGTTPVDRPKLKAETAERKRVRAEGIATRHATDIVYLGRGVSKSLGDRRTDVARLESLGLPVIGSPLELAEAMGITVPRLRWLAFHAEAATRVHYVTFEVAKKSGGTRTLSAPHRSMASAQAWILARIIAQLPAEPQAHGFLPGRSILTNASGHAGKAIVVNMDLEGFFPSIGFPRVRSVFWRLGYSPSVATILGLLCTECPRRRVVYEGTPYFVATGPRGLPQGACTSPGLSNQVARRLDRRLAGIAAKLDLVYTRYADDLTFSGDDVFNPRVGYLMARVRHIAEAEGFAVNEAKSRVLRRNAAQVVTGLVVNDRPGVPRDEVRRLRASIHRIKVEGFDAAGLYFDAARSNDGKDRESLPEFLPWLRGKIAYVSMVRPEVGRRLLEDLEAALDRVN